MSIGAHEIRKRALELAIDVRNDEAGFTRGESSLATLKRAKVFSDFIESGAVPAAEGQGDDE